MKRILLFGIPALILIGLMFTNAPYQWLTQRSIEDVLIKDKQISTESDKRDGKVVSTYLIYTDQGVFRNDDAGWHVKFNSSDVYGNLDKGKRYRMKVYGWRIPIFSMYPNIVRVEEVTPVAAAKAKK
ncbi:MAG: DUF1523 family protein [Rickettsiales bacterium]|nr:DUF1523 family protein [Rickettsiales bacterium]